MTDTMKRLVGMEDEEEGGEDEEGAAWDDPLGGKPQWEQLLEQAKELEWPKKEKVERSARTRAGQAAPRPPLAGP